jgi:hypothetical protein
MRLLDDFRNSIAFLLAKSLRVPSHTNMSMNATSPIQTQTNLDLTRLLKAQLLIQRKPRRASIQTNRFPIPVRFSQQVSNEHLSQYLCVDATAPVERFPTTALISSLLIRHNNASGKEKMGQGQSQ